MESGIDHFKDLLEVLSFVATIIGGIAILFAVRSYSISRKQLNFAALESCIKRYRDHFLDLNHESPESKVIRYVDLVNEELFYFQHRYLPFDVAEEWIDGMIEHLPIYDKSGIVLNPGYFIPVIDAQKILDQYRFRRVKKTFTISANIKVDAVYGDGRFPIQIKEREKLVKAIVKNLKRDTTFF